ncbi:LamG domain-containing protein [Paludibaculum fermentans]|uniref:LamG domain-containing protein n=1 Tax=Paludibaculum fermentans TaxID=1473598 RepID=A0A7S7NUG3_PALFE|nr:LamG domain-containing protein [Paludibaculum fermentans]QOY90046.1 LamG domain-containing protein [Paludibaculum fermentans]
MMRFAQLVLALSVAPLLAAQTQFSTDLLAMKPIGYWPLHGNANDASGHGAAGSPGSNLTFTGAVGPLGSGAAPAAVFDSSGPSFVTIPAPSSSALNLDALHPMTILAWIRTIRQTPGDMIVAAKFDPQAATGWGLLVDNGSLGAPQAGGRLALVFVSGDNLTLSVESTISVNDGGWHLVAATYDGSGKASGVRLYSDGVPLAMTTVVDNISAGPIQSSAPFTIGGAANGDDAFEGNVNEVAVFSTVLTPEQNLQLMLGAPGLRRILGQFAFGGGWASALYFSNTSTAALTIPVSFTGDDGKPMTVPSIGGSSQAIHLEPGASAVIEAPNVGSLVQGYVTAYLPVGITGYGVFRQSTPGAPDQEAVVQFAGVGGQFQMLVYDDRNSLISAAAILNPSPVATTVGITATDENGKVIGTASVDLPPFGKLATTLRSLPGLEQFAGNRGTVQFAVTKPTNFTGSVSVLGLRFNGTAITSIPAGGKARGDF